MKLNKLITPFVVLFMLSIAFAVFPTILRGSLPDQQSGVWIAGPQMAHVRAGATATVMYDGRVLVAGGKDESGAALASVDIIDLEGAITAAPAMNVARSGHAAVWLYDGYVLVSGGTTTGGGVTNTAELYDPLSNSWRLLPGTMSDPRTGHTAINLLDGRIVIAGGSNGSSALSSVETFSIVDETFSFAGVMDVARHNHAAAALLDGRVLIVGGANADGATLSSTSIFDPETNSIAAGPALNEAREDATATTLLDGTVLVAGGRNAEGETASLEIIDDHATSSRLLPSSMATARAGHSAVLLKNNNQVLLVGGTSAGSAVNSSELYTPWTGQLKSGVATLAAHANAVSANLAVPGRAILAGGGTASTEIYAYATVSTDAIEYIPGQTVLVSGAGWQPGETVMLKFHRTDGAVPDRTFEVAASLAGNFVNQDFTLQSSDEFTHYLVTAVGAISQAQTQFADALSLSSMSVQSTPGAGLAGSNFQFGLRLTTTGTGNNTLTGNVTLTTAPSGVTLTGPVAFSIKGAASVDQTVTVSTTAAVAGGQYNLTFGNSLSSATTTGTLTVNQSPVISTQPSSQTVSYPSNAAFSVVANGYPAVGYQWYVSTDHGSSWAIVPGATSATYTLTSPQGSTSGNMYRCVVTNVVGSVTSNAVTLTVNKASQTINFGSLLNRTYKDAPFSVSANATSGLPVTFTVGSSDNCTIAGSTVTITGAGSCTVTAAQSGDSNYSAAPSVPQTFAIAKAVATVTLSDMSQGFTGSALTPTATTNPVGLNVVWTGAPQTYVGGYSVTATVSDANYQGSASGTFTIGKTDQTITFGALGPKVYGDAPFTVNASATSGLPVTFTVGSSDNCTISASTVTITGAGSCTVTAVQSGNANYNAATSVAQTFSISKAAATIAIANVSQTYNGSPKPVTITTTPLNLAATVTYGGSSTVPTNAGSYAVVASINDSNYTATPANDTLVIAKAASTITLSNLSQTFDGSAKPVGVATTPTTLAITITYDGNATAPTNAGTYAVVVASNDPNYTGSASGSLVITKANATVSLNGLGRTFDGSPKAVTASTVPAGLATSVTYDGNTTAPSAVGSYSVVATVTDSNYVGTSTGTLTIDSAAATVLLGNLTATYDGTAKTVSVTTTPIGLATSITYNGSTSAPTNAGTYAIVATVTEPNHTGSATGSFTIAKADQTITFGALSSKNVTDAPFTITASSSSNLPVSFSATGGCSVAGSTVTITEVGNCSITANQGGGTNYNAATPVLQSFTVGGGVPSIGWAAPQAIVYGTPIGATQLTAAATYGGTPLAGTYDYSPAAGTVLGVGVHTLNVTFHPTDSLYNSVNGNVQITVAPATVVVAAPTLARSYGDPNPAANPTYGAFVNGESSAIIATPPTCGSSATATSHVGNYPITCAGATASNYQFTYVPGVLTVAAAALSVTPNNASRPQGQSNPIFTGTITGLKNSDPITATYSTTATSSSTFGTYPITAAVSDAGSGALANYAVTLNTGTLTVTNNKADLAEALTVLTQNPLAGGPLKFVDTVSNSGGTDAPGSVTRVYLLSGTSKLTTLLARSEASIAAGASGQPITTTATLPTNLFGTYSVLACADDNSSIVESSETNNCANVAIRIGAPDLAVSSFAIPASAISGGSISVSDSVVNIGVADAVASVNRFYLVSGTTRLSMIGTQTVASLKAGIDSGALNTTLTLPSNISGNYTIQVCADDTLAVFESDETNNCRSSSTLSVGAPDMVVRSITAPSSAISGASITLVDATANQGVADARASVTRFYLVNGTTRVSALGTRSVGALATGASSGPASTTLSLPTNIVGTYTIQACADDTLTVSESDESNNCASSSSLTVAGADMVVSSINAPATATAGGSISVTETTVNRGPADARASVTRFYLLNGSTRVAVLGTRNVVALTSGSSSGPVSTSLVLPSKTTGTFTIQACADDTLTVSESDENNNCMGSTTMTITK